MELLWVFYLGIGVGLLFLLLGLPMAFNKIKPNGFYGFRTKKTLSNEKIWYAANCFSGKMLSIAGSAIAVLCGICLLYVSMSQNAAGFTKDTIAFIFLGIVFIPLAITIAASLFYIRKL